LFEAFLVLDTAIQPISLILLPGLDGAGILFQSLVAALPSWIKPIVVRYPSERHLSYTELLPLVVEALPRDEPFILLGESFSGPLAVMAAAQRPAGLAGVILCASFVSNPRPIIGAFCRLLPLSCLFRMFPLVQRVKPRIAGYSSSELSRLLDAVHAEMRPQVMAARLRMVFRVDVRKELAQCAVPLLYISGGRDFVVPRRNLRIVRRIVPHARCATISAPHMVLQSEPARSAAVISDFVNQASSG
jgi:pimeloyl-[acyl-carrier protein] methyl ester esterase